jgi:hypothetical protein
VKDIKEVQADTVRMLACYLVMAPGTLKDPAKHWEAYQRVMDAIEGLKA